ncbi:hypothetical protein T484DRAFT_1788003 [Baffinella frigidus]|nr:hypothetical protein T484DRAFT_1788003 [Cryptophyta sp. CCMP2293]
MHLRVATALLFALLFALACLEVAESRPDFAASDAELPAHLRRRNLPSSAEEPRRFKQTMRDVDGKKSTQGTPGPPRELPPWVRVRVRLVSSAEKPRRESADAKARLRMMVSP